MVGCRTGKGTTVSLLERDCRREALMELFGTQAAVEGIAARAEPD